MGIFVCQAAYKIIALFSVYITDFLFFSLDVDSIIFLRRFLLVVRRPCKSSLFLHSIEAQNTLQLFG